MYDSNFRLAFSLFVICPFLIFAQKCSDHPRFASACRNVQNLKEWCNRSKLQGDQNKYNFANVCKATCGFCKASDTSDNASQKIIFEAEPDGKPALTLQLATVQQANVATQKPNKQVILLTKPRSQEKITTPVKATTTTIPSTTAAGACGTAPNYTPCVPLAFSNTVFQQCCESSGIGQACLHLCRYDVKVEEVQLAAFKQQCPFSILPTYFVCASRNGNNTACCQDTGVLSEAGPQCATFCDPKNGAFGTVGVKHLRCASYLEEIMQCHWAGLR